MATHILIPARYASSRLPAKPLLAETGQCLILHVVENVLAIDGVDSVTVATDDQRIADVVTAAGYQAVMTRVDHASGTDRLAEAAATLGFADDDIVVNVQGDEPDIPAELVLRLIDLLETTDAPMATLATPLPDDQAADPNKVKAVFTPAHKALYFSRAKIPHDRDATHPGSHFLHIGMYGYRAGFLQTFTTLPAGTLEQIECLEQLRVLEAGYDIAIDVVDYDGGGIDTPEDYAEFVRRMKG
ncbi:MAG: 3-deoxy-manno-octulosonate cytidylyltransferase [Phycisphaerales bacterium]|jgi:3-deoxy-manno-octulosonate cytidylyltransferase (CMP-KDO synthetase)|nr:3-deoxy-manno-octulosonate cytidylyltransferase [Phycisphaerales bacterium]MBT7171137.1 3-deoxy-manno-octulosonate cytidylyltransferase [Phycisphaerales bacterium]